MEATSFIERAFSELSLKKNKRLWLSSDETRLEDRIRLLASFPICQFEEVFASNLDGKNPKLASHLLDKANLAFAQGDNDTSLKLLNQSLQFAGDSEIGQIYFSRAALWSSLGQDQFVLADLAQALERIENGSEQYLKALEKRAQAHVHLQETEKANAAIEEAQAILVQIRTRLKKNVASGYEKRLQKLLKSNTRDQPLKTPPEALIPSLESSNPLIPSFSSNVQVQFEASRGRYCVAAGDIACGDLIAKDSSYCSILDYSKVREFCWHCFKRLKYALPCKSCTIVLFCSDICQTSSQSSHRVECGLLGSLYRANFGAWILAFKAIIKNPFEVVSSLIESSENQKANANSKLSDDSPFISKDLRSFDKLVGHDSADSGTTTTSKLVKGEGDQTQQAAGLMMEALVTLFLLRCLEHQGYFPPETPPLSSESPSAAFAFARKLNHFMRIAYFNTHEVTTTDKNDNVSPVTRIGRGIYPTLALINHSCFPNYRRICINNVTLGIAIRPIKRGDEIADTYCPTFASVDKEARDLALEKYRFACNCSACSNNWPQFAHLNNNSDAVTKAKQHLSKSEEKLLNQMRKTRQYNHHAIQTLQKYITFLAEGTQPCKELVTSENELYNCFVRKYAGEYT
ncbi:hypothetical protein TCAL_06487 [Tigriopus californicus]|uniref:Protein-lysine N-methyltransferase SMYD4 n=1 Tax=Tigriopus californicus TaxID=6832 RepID=A0A553PK71_TIGCA|nr:SET and MYND domain-containing protein 4-like [Tigriopus californicus]TRY78056.1 hypothetical protein TCAL_06487 [Tigriopus californicus]|eukprot:TCALIF_06487-PA protein Name:"Similar to SMYD4 SET and MYND domain-containing protein 4 (Pongo abelii)" AED:0.01 eAED:0.01 QI:10/1/0.66/1/1/1/3/0/629